MASAKGQPVHNALEYPYPVRTALILFAKDRCPRGDTDFLSVVGMGMFCPRNPFAYKAFAHLSAIIT